MGVITNAAARLGLRLAGASAVKKKISSSSSSWLSLFTRRSPSTSLDLEAAATTYYDVDNKKSGSEKEFKNDKTLYLCFIECRKCVDPVVRPIRLDSYDDNEEEELREEVYCNSRFEMDWICRCTSFGSQILFSVGPKTPKHICWIDPFTRPLKFEVSSPNQTKFKSFPQIKCDMVWGEVDRKLYCLNNDAYCRGSVPHSHPFEVLDPENDDDDATWRPLDSPPFIRNTDDCHYNALFLNGSKKILGWEYNVPVVFCFDTTKPENGWKESPSSLGETIPFLYYENPFVIHDHHPGLGDFNLMFAYDPEKEPFLVYPFFLSDNCDSFFSIDTPIRLPELCSKYVVHEDDDDECDPWTYVVFEFVHLGARKFGLVMHEYYLDDPDDERRSKGIILVITFEYDIIITSNDNKDSKPNLKIQTRVLGTRRFRYIPQPHYKNSWDAHMTGAFFV